MMTVSEMKAEASSRTDMFFERRAYRLDEIDEDEWMAVFRETLIDVMEEQGL